METDIYNAHLIQLWLDSRIYSREGILKCLYWYSDRYHTDIQLTSSQSFQLTLRPKEETLIPDPSHAYQRLLRDLLDFQLRDTISRETANIRDLLVAKAFANGALDDEPPGHISDPVGFHIPE